MKEWRTGCQWLMPIILATQEAEIRSIEVRRPKQAQPSRSMRPCLKKPFTKIGLVEWFKVKVLSSSPSTPPTHKI
jgi:hypothetical protein